MDSETHVPVNILLNGEVREVAADITLDQLLIQLELPRQRIAVELNQTVVRRVDWANAQLKEGDRVEIVHFVGGGISDLHFVAVKM